MPAKPKRKKSLDPYMVALKEMRRVEAENVRANKEREAAQAAKELAFRKQAEHDALERQRKVDEAQREVAAAFKKSRDKAAAAEKERAAAEKARFHRLAKETRDQIDKKNEERREKERQAEANLKEVREAEFVAMRQRHNREARLVALRLRNERRQQLEEQAFMKAWHTFEHLRDGWAQTVQRERFAGYRTLTEGGAGGGADAGQVDIGESARGGGSARITSGRTSGRASGRASGRSSSPGRSNSSQPPIGRAWGSSLLRPTPSLPLPTSLPVSLPPKTHGTSYWHGVGLEYMAGEQQQDQQLW